MPQRLEDKVRGLTQRLDHSVPDPKLSWAENRAAATELKLLSDALYDLLPDRSLSPMERLERLGRAMEEREPKLDLLRPAAEKLKELKSHIDGLVPGDASTMEKLVTMGVCLDEKVGEANCSLPTTQKLELLGDPRGKVEPE